MIVSSANFQDEEESDVDTNNEEEKQASLWSKEPTSLKTGSTRNGYTARDVLLILVLAIATVFIAVALVAILRPRKATPRFLENEGNSTLRENIFKNKQLLANASNTFLSTETTAICDTPPPPPLPGKKGIGMTLRDEGEGSWMQHLPRILALKPYWNYAWNIKRIPQQPEDIEFVPMVWGPARTSELMQEKIEEHLRPQVEQGLAKRVLGFNEPDKLKQSNTDPVTACDRWPLLESLNVSLVSPSCAKADSEWMENFMNDSIAKCHRVDWIGVHWYGSSNFESFAAKMRRIYELHQRPILITEFAPADYNALTVQENRHSPAEVLNFMKQALPWLEAQDWVAGYAWFSFPIDKPVGTSSALFDANGNFTACGRFYASVRTDNPYGDQSIQVD